MVQCTNLGTVPIDQTFWPKGQYGGCVEVLLGIGDLSFEVIFNYKGLFFITHNLSSNHEIAWGGNYSETLDQTVSFPNDSHLVTETPILMTKVTLENCDEKTESLIEKQQVQSSLSAKSYASV